jgi:hypothetical protein
MMIMMMMIMKKMIMASSCMHDSCTLLYALKLPKSFCNHILTGGVLVIREHDCSPDDYAVVIDIIHVSHFAINDFVIVILNVLIGQ